METMIGFVIGYYFGTQQGRAGLAKSRDALEAILKSDETRQTGRGRTAGAQAVGVRRPGRHNQWCHRAVGPVGRRRRATPGRAA